MATSQNMAFKNVMIDLFAHNYSNTDRCNTILKLKCNNIDACILQEIATDVDITPCMYAVFRVLCSGYGNVDALNYLVNNYQIQINAVHGLEYVSFADAKIINFLTANGYDLRANFDKIITNAILRYLNGTDCVYTCVIEYLIDYGVLSDSVLTTINTSINLFYGNQCDLILYISKINKLAHLLATHGYNIDNLTENYLSVALRGQMQILKIYEKLGCNLGLVLNNMLTKMNQ